MLRKVIILGMVIAAVTLNGFSNVDAQNVVVSGSGGVEIVFTTPGLKMLHGKVINHIDFSPSFFDLLKRKAFV